MKLNFGNEIPYLQLQVTPAARADLHRERLARCEAEAAACLAVTSDESRSASTRLAAQGGEVDWLVAAEMEREDLAMIHVVPVSGGKDSTALALRLAEDTSMDFTYLITPTGNELPEMLAHWERLECMLGKPFVRITNHDLRFWIEYFNALPNWRQRWCTRLLKIEPCLAWVKRQPGPVTLYVGLRADEEERKGIYSNDVITRFPLREWGWGLPQIQDYLRDRGVSIPERTDCAWCYGQRLHEWKALLRQHPELYAEAEDLEAMASATFRSPGRDSMPASLVQLRTAIDKGKFFKQDQLSLVPEQEPCRICSL